MVAATGFEPVTLRV